MSQIGHNIRAARRVADEAVCMAKKLKCDLAEVNGELSAAKEELAALKEEMRSKFEAISKAACSTENKEITCRGAGDAQHRA
jgi:hypothetical protein|tara:strand:+ start:3288 stop:3533 length:246 start_codon:yes stop_codon:yes gene_type:complete